MLKTKEMMKGLNSRGRGRGEVRRVLHFTVTLKY